MSEPNTALSHAERAREVMKLLGDTAGRLTTDQMLAKAQVHATLALAEATRTHNMLMVSQVNYAIADDVLRRVND